MNNENKQQDVCAFCGKPIAPEGEHWVHVGLPDGVQPRHFAFPLDRWVLIETNSKREGMSVTYITTPTPRRGPTEGCCG